MDPTPRLREYAIGDTVTLKMAASQERPFFIGAIQRDGYYQLWNDHRSYIAGKPWNCLASGCHAVSEHKPIVDQD